MITHALIEVGTNKILKKVNAAKEFRTGSPPVLRPKKGLKWLPYVIDPDPVYDEETQIRESRIEVVSDSAVTQTKPVRYLTAEELAGRKQDKITGMDRFMARITEDMLVKLLEKGVIEKGDFPAIVWNRINARRVLRGQPEV